MILSLGAAGSEVRAGVAVFIASPETGHAPLLLTAFVPTVCRVVTTTATAGSLLGNRSSGLTPWTVEVSLSLLAVVVTRGTLKPSAQGFWFCVVEAVVGRIPPSV